MIRLPALLGVVLSLVLVSCAPTTVGIACDKRTDCAPGQECILEAPGGFCTRGCTEPGEVRDCPVGSICTLFGGSNQVCSVECTVDADCRINFRCELTGGTSGKSACRPVTLP